MKFFSFGKDGGKDSTVSGFWLFEIKSLFSIVFLIFQDGSRENYHSHAFNAITWFFKGKTVEHTINPNTRQVTEKEWTPSMFPKYTPRNQYHKHYSQGTTWALSFRGPWNDCWQEYNSESDRFTTLTHGRKVI